MRIIFIILCLLSCTKIKHVNIKQGSGQIEETECSDEIEIKKAIREAEVQRKWDSLFKDNERQGLYLIRGDTLGRWFIVQF